ncbi:MAG: hypothetical protein OFPI_26860 [Osedax symbiont Rs2]|nr:MAG: hypothetical protein OFPI_26860 [Osedax symbiont Rs2]
MVANVAVYLAAVFLELCKAKNVNDINAAQSELMVKLVQYGRR